MLLERKEILDVDESIGYIEAVFNSGNVLKTTYFPKINRLYIAFNRGQTYSYSNINSDFYNAFETADSQGKFFHSKINNNKLFPYRKEFTLYPKEVSDIKQIVENHSIDNDEDE